MSHFYPIDNSARWGKNGMCPIFTAGVSNFYSKSQDKEGTSLKVIFLITLTKPFSVPQSLPETHAVATVVGK